MVAQALLTSKNEHFCTPRPLLHLLTQVGPIGVDPCSNANSLVPAAVKWGEAEDGLSRSWAGLGMVYTNPPYGAKIRKWLPKILYEARNGVEIILLGPARTDTSWFQRHVPFAQVTLFWRGRITFEGAKHPAPFPSFLSLWSPSRERVALFSEVFRTKGWMSYGPAWMTPR